MPSPPQSESNCQKTRLASYGSYYVDRCSCGAVHVTAGPVTLHMDRGAYRQFLETLQAAVELIPPAVPQPIPGSTGRPSLSLVADQEALR